MALLMDLWVWVFNMHVIVLDSDASLVLENLVELLLGVMILGLAQLL